MQSQREELLEKIRNSRNNPERLRDVIREAHSAGIDQAAIDEAKAEKKQGDVPAQSTKNTEALVGGKGQSQSGQPQQPENTGISEKQT